MIEDLTKDIPFIYKRWWGVSTDLSELDGTKEAYAASMIAAWAFVSDEDKEMWRAYDA